MSRNDGELSWNVRNRQVSGEWRACSYRRVFPRFLGWATRWRDLLFLDVPRNTVPVSNTQQASARARVKAELSARKWEISRLRDATGLDPGTIGDFLDGKRHARFPTLGKIEAAFGWEPGYLDSLDSGDAPPPLDDEPVSLDKLSDDDLIAELCRRLAERRELVSIRLHQDRGRPVGQRSAAHPGRRP